VTLWFDPTSGSAFKLAVELNQTEERKRTMPSLHPTHRRPLPPVRGGGCHPRGVRSLRSASWSPLNLNPEADLRIIVNPLGWLGLVAWLGLMFWTNWPLVWTGPLGLGIPWLFRYYCWDCGGGGLLWRWTKHTCPAVQRRRAQGGHPRPWWWLAPSLQLWAWLYLIVAILVCWYA